MKKKNQSNPSLKAFMINLQILLFFEKKSIQFKQSLLKAFE